MGREITRSDLTGEFSGVAMDRATYQARPLSSIPGDGESLSWIGSGDSSNPGQEIGGRNGNYGLHFRRGSSTRMQ